MTETAAAVIRTETGEIQSLACCRLHHEASCWVRRNPLNLGHFPSPHPRAPSSSSRIRTLILRLQRPLCCQLHQQAYEHGREAPDEPRVQTTCD